MIVRQSRLNDKLIKWFNDEFQNVQHIRDVDMSAVRFLLIISLTNFFLFNDSICATLHITKALQGFQNRQFR